MPTFSSQFLARDTQEDMKEGFDRFCFAVGRLYADLKMLSPGLEELSRLGEVCSTHSTSYGERTVLGLFCLALRGTLHSQIPHHWEELVRQLYSQAFSTFYKSGDRPNSSVQDMEDSGDWSGDLTCGRCGNQTEACLSVSHHHHGLPAHHHQDGGDGAGGEDG